tara:strand:+ start:947 stop:1468 length:522 start_codon:yes stop_codon:yes gene_type:complete
LKKTLIIFFCLISTTSFGQDKWTVYPKKKNIKKTDSTISKISFIDDSIEVKDSLKLDYISDKGHLIFVKDYRLDSLNKYLAKYGKFKGFTVQLIVSQETQLIKDTRKNFIQNFPNETLYDEYNAPNIFLYAGKFHSRSDAVLLKKKMEGFFNNTMVVMKSFSFSAGQKSFGSK